MTTPAEILDACDAVHLHANAPCRACAEAAIAAAVLAERADMLQKMESLKMALLWCPGIPAGPMSALVEEVDRIIDRRTVFDANGGSRGSR